MATFRLRRRARTTSIRFLKPDPLQTAFDLQAGAAGGWGGGPLQKARLLSVALSSDGAVKHGKATRIVLLRFPVQVAPRRTAASDPSSDRYLFESRWPKGLSCPRCGGASAGERPKGRTHPHRSISNLKAWLHGTHRDVSGSTCRSTWRSSFGGPFSYRDRLLLAAGRTRQASSAARARAEDQHRSQPLTCSHGLTSSACASPRFVVGYLIPSSRIPFVLGVHILTTSVLVLEDTVIATSVWH